MLFVAKSYFLPDSNESRSLDSVLSYLLSRFYLATFQFHTSRVTFLQIAFPKKKM